MGFEIDRISNFGFIDMETDEKFELSDAFIEIDTLCPNEKPEIRSFGRSFRTREVNFTCENSMINEKLLLELFLPKKLDTFDLQYTTMVQARRHRKKRINKKWLKRYGYKPKQIISKGWKIDTYNTQTGEVELVKR